MSIARFGLGLVLVSLALTGCQAPGAAAASDQAVAPSSATAAVSSVPRVGDAQLCRSQLFQGHPPQLPTVQLVNAVLICRPSMAILASGLSRTGLWSAEYLSPDRIRAAHEQHRENTFHPDPNLPPQQRAELRDYVHSGYDRGHLSPSADQPSPATQDDSFSLANMAPQAPRLNRGPWEHLEVAVRRYAAQTPVYVITGVRFTGDQVMLLNRRVMVPTTYYKVIYDPARALGIVYEAPNFDTGQPQTLSVEQFEHISGIRLGLGTVRPLNLNVQE